MKPTEAMVEAGAAAAFESRPVFSGTNPDSPRWTWVMLDDVAKTYWREQVRTALTAALASLDVEGVLEPFASLKCPESAPDEAMLVLTTTNGGIIDASSRVTVGDLRAARTLLDRIRGE